MPIFFIDANGWFGDGGWTKMRGKKTIWKKVVSGSFVGCLLEFSPKSSHIPSQKNTVESIMSFDFPFPKV